MRQTDEAYLTKRIIQRATRRGIREAARETMDVMGYVIVAREGWLVKKYANGEIEKLQQAENSPEPGPTRLD